MGEPATNEVPIGTALTALVVVFAAELGDRTQLLLFALATRHRPAPILAGLLLGYGATTALGVLVGTSLGAALPETAVTIGSGLAFLGLAAWTLRTGDDDPGPPEAEEATDTTRHPALLAASIAGALVVSELGDKSQLATLTLAADGEPVAVATGALLGIMCAGALGVIAGRVLAGRIAPRALRLGSATLLAVVGTVLLLRAM